MKILKLKIKNLASLAGEQEINFESAPLAHAGLIAITGKTGSGKSTLLDAMCLALYNKIPRLANASGNMQDASGKAIAVQDSKHILRRSTVHGYAELEFVALDQKRYCAYWEVKRAYKKINGTLSYTHAIRSVEEGKILTQKSGECAELIKTLIGLDFQQFTRAVLLAQSEVGAFLKAKDQERADLLEYLTNSNIFGLISKLSFEKTKHYNEQLDRVKTSLGDIQILSQQQIDDYNLERQKLVTQHEQRLQQGKILDDDQQWYQQQQQWRQQQQEIITKQQQHLQQQNSIAIQSQFLTALDEFSSIRNIFEEAEHIEQQQLSLKQKKELKLQEFITVEQQYLQSKQQLVQSEQHLKQLKDSFEHVQPSMQQALQYDTERARIGQEYRAKKAELDKQKLQLDEETKQYEGIQKQYNARLQQLETQQQQLTQSQDIAHLAIEPNATIEKINTFLMQTDSLATKTQHIKHFNADDFAQLQHELQQEIVSLQEKYGSLEYIEQQHTQLQHDIKIIEQQQHTAQQFSRSLNTCLNLSTDKDNLQQAIRILEHTIQQQQQRVKETEQAYQEAEQHALQVQNILNEQRLLQSENIQNLRSELKADKPCMVCGSCEHPFVEHEERLHAALHQIQNIQQQQAIDKRNQTLATFDTVKQDLLTNQTKLSHQQQRFTEISTQLSNAQQQLAQDLVATGFEIDLSQSLIDIQSQFDVAYCTLNQRYKQATQQFDIFQQQLTHLKQLFAQQKQHQDIVVTLTTYQHTADTLFKQLNSQWQTKWQNDAIRTAHQLIDAIKQRVKQQNDLLHVQQQLQDSKPQLDTMQHKIIWLQEQIERLSKLVNQITADGKNNTAQLNALLQQHQVTQFTSGKEWQADLQQQLLNADSQISQYRQQFEQQQQRFQTQQHAMTQLDSQAKVWQQQSEQLESKKSTWLGEHSHFDTALITQCRITQLSDIQRMRQTIEKFIQQHTEIETHLKLIETQLDEHQKKQPSLTVEQLLQQRQSLQAQLEQLNQHRNEIDVILLSNASRTKELEKYQQKIDDLQYQINRWGRISNLIGQSDGAKFKRIAQQYHLDILVEYANQQLKPLAPRYQLQRIEESLGLCIIDHDMNDEIRPVLSLSGGESFLVSLALALAIANMASGSMKLESLFIDEGFGTLDPSSLQIAMDALDRLQSQGRKVILISHVQEMHERIPVQIQIQPVGAGASTINIVG